MKLLKSDIPSKTVFSSLHLHLYSTSVKFFVYPLQGGVSPSSTAGSDVSDSFVCDMTSAIEPLYGDPGEEEAYQY